MSTASKTNPERPYDPAMLRSRWEASLILGLWACCMVYTCTYCYLYGYQTHAPLRADRVTGPDIAEVAGPMESFNRDPESLTYPFGLGIPDWVFWGIVTPWAVCIVLSVIFCLFIFKEEDLGEDHIGEQTGEN